MLDWILTLIILVPEVNMPVHLEMGFSQRRYCNFAMEKVLESNPTFTINGQEIVGTITESKCERR